MGDYNTQAARSGGSVDSASTEGEEVYLLAGPLGSGKSTVADMIERHYNGSTAAFEMSDYVRNCYYADVGGESVDDNTLGEWAAEKKMATSATLVTVSLTTWTPMKTPPTRLSCLVFGRLKRRICSNRSGV